MWAKHKLGSFTEYISLFFHLGADIKTENDVSLNLWDLFIMSTFKEYLKKLNRKISSFNLSKKSFAFIDYTSLGCYGDSQSRAIPTLEGKDPILDGDYTSRKNATAKCAIAARRKGFHMFALQHGGWCASSATAEKTFDKYGKSGDCQNDGEGGPLANHVYVIKG